MSRSSLTASLLGAILVIAMPPGAHAAGQGETLATGSFEGRSGHTVSGAVSIVAAADGFRLVLQDDFRLDGAPDPRIALGRNGYVAETQFSRVRENSGRQTYQLPRSIDPTKYTQVWLWCEAFSVPLGVADLR